MSCIYLVTNKINDKKYIGQTKHNVEKRKKEHIKYSLKDNAKNTYALSNALKKHGVENFTFTVVEEGKLSLENLNKLECFYIKKYNTIAPNGYNLTLGGNKQKVSESTIKLMKLRAQERKELPKYEEYRKKNKSILTKRNKDPEFIKIVKEKTIQQWKNPEIRKSMSESLSLAQKERFANNPNEQINLTNHYKKYFKNLKSDPEKFEVLKQQRSLQSKKGWEEMKKNTERYAKLKEQRKQAAGKQWKNPEIRNEMSKKISIKAIERCNTPEFRKKLSEQSKKQWAASKRRKTAIKRTKLCKEMFLSGKHSIKDICEEAGVSISSFYKYKNNNFIVK